MFGAKVILVVVLIAAPCMNAENPLNKIRRSRQNAVKDVPHTKPSGDNGKAKRELEAQTQGLKNREIEFNAKETAHERDVKLFKEQMEREKQQLAAEKEKLASEIAQFTNEKKVFGVEKAKLRETEDRLNAKQSQLVAEEEKLAAAHSRLAKDLAASGTDKVSLAEERQRLRAEWDRFDAERREFEAKQTSDRPEPKENGGWKIPFISN